MGELNCDRLEAQNMEESGIVVLQLLPQGLGWSVLWIDPLTSL